MAWHGDPTWLKEALEAEGVPVKEIPGWDKHGHGDFGKVWGSMWHHTGHNATSAQFCFDGRSDLPGPICNIHLGRDGVATLCAVGVAWHAGTGRYKDIPRNAGNQVTIGIEMQGDGKNWPPVMWASAVKIAAAISKKIGKPANRSVCAHKEYSNQGKWDPGAWDMNAFRHQVQTRITGHNPAPIAQTKPPGWVLPSGYYYGPLEGPPASISGRAGEPATYIDALKKWQEAVGITPSGVYDHPTKQAAITVQKSAGYKPDGLIGVGTFIAGMKLAGKPPAHATTGPVFTSKVPGAKVVAPLSDYVLWMDARTVAMNKKLDHIITLMEERNG